MIRIQISVGNPLHRVMQYNNAPAGGWIGPTIYTYIYFELTNSFDSADRWKARSDDLWRLYVHRSRKHVEWHRSLRSNKLEERASLYYCTTQRTAASRPCARATSHHTCAVKKKPRISMKRKREKKERKRLVKKKEAK